MRPSNLRVWGKLHAMVADASRTGTLAAQTGDLFDLAGIVISVGLVGLVAGGATGILRIVLALAFALFVPGRAVVTNWPRLAHWSQFAMSMILSLAILALVATVALWVHAWHPVGLFEAEAGLSAAAVVAGMARRHRLTPEDAVSE
jgi:uncharacterized membrane protein